MRVRTGEYLLLSFALLLASATVALSKEEHQCLAVGEHHAGSCGRRHGGEEQYPFVFQREEFETQAVSGESIFRMLPRFSDRSELFEGIKDYRLAFLLVESQTFVVPNHEDAEFICTVVLGRGSVAVIRQDGKESFNIYEGDVLRIPPGTTTYIVNTDNVKKVPLEFFILIRSISTPGRFEFFSGAAGKKPMSFFKGFSRETLEAALNTKWETIEGVLFGEAQEEGPFLKVTEEQLWSLSQEGDEGGIRPFRGDETSKDRTINVFPHKTVSNQFGVIYEVGTKHFKPLDEVDVNAAFVNITETVRSRLKTGMVVVIPPGYTYVAVATSNPSKSLQFGWFDINGRGNERVTLAGTNNLFIKLGKTAKKLSFAGSDEEDVNVVFGSQPLELFFKAPPSSLNPDQ
nr:vicilin-like antimicrobial peptides 2-2 [Ipomoea batatas]